MDDTDTKPGWKSTEFWMNIAVVLATTTLLSIDKISVEDVQKLWPVFLGPGIGYSVSRGLAKLR
jgi:hypothetical protein